MHQTLRLRDTSPASSCKKPLSHAELLCEWQRQRQRSALELETGEQKNRDLPHTHGGFCGPLRVKGVCPNLSTKLVVRVGGNAANTANSAQAATPMKRCRKGELVSSLMSPSVLPPHISCLSSQDVRSTAVISKKEVDHTAKLLLAPKVAPDGNETGKVKNAEKMQVPLEHQLYCVSQKIATARAALDRSERKVGSLAESFRDHMSSAELGLGNSTTPQHAHSMLRDLPLTNKEHTELPISCVPQMHVTNARRDHSAPLISRSALEAQAAHAASLNQERVQEFDLLRAEVEAHRQRLVAQIASQPELTNVRYGPIGEAVRPRLC